MLFRTCEKLTLLQRKEEDNARGLYSIRLYKSIPLTRY